MLIRMLPPREDLWAVAAATLAALATAALVVRPHSPAGYLLASAALLVNLYRHGRRGLGRCIATHPAIVAGLLAAYVSRRPDELPQLFGAGAVLLVMVIGEGMVAKVAAPLVDVANAPHWRRLATRGVRRAAIFRINVALMIVVGVCAAAGAPPVLAFTVVSCGAIAQAGLVLAALRATADPRGPKELSRELAHYAPEFLVHFSAPADMAYQVLMWLPHLERVGRPFAVVVREEQHLASVAAATRVPVLYCPSIRALDLVVTRDLRAVYYVNNGMKNLHMLRFTGLLHVQLLHGDSDKTASFNPVTNLYDRVYVAGQAGIDRYRANGVHIPAERFRVVGRPQLARIAVGPRREHPPSPPTVLYAPTWTGFYEDTNHCSLRVATRIITSLLGRGATVILRAHPSTSRNRRAAAQLAAAERLLARDRAATGRAHLWGDRSAREMSLADCVNASDALVADVSSVVTDYLYSGRPFAITDMAGAGAALSSTFPLSRIGYVIDAELTTLEHVLDAMLGPDPLAEQRLDARAYYLGDFPAKAYERVFLETVRGDLDAAGQAGAARTATVSRDAEWATS
ncbi:CDP-glycerol glycerophosphotransferase family protein [Luedemannella helvata]|uniref:CDP-glycerol glycerophosphotransferase family protein n=1 Tax=Luedemannella helvata TaxID=349315 RepID=A0ABN2L5L0_9ACTN